MAISFLDDFRASLAAIKDDPDLFGPLIERFSELPLFVPTTDPANVPEGKVGILFIELDAFPGVPALVATLDRASSQSLFHLDADRITEINGNVLLAMARGNRFVLVIREGEDIETFEYERLLVLAQGLALTSGDAPAAPDPNIARDAYPQAFADWLYDYCKRQPDISRAWLALLSVGSEGRPNVCVVFDNDAPAAHDQRVREQTALLLPGQMLYEYDQLQGMTGRDGSGAVAQIRAQAPFYSRSQKHGWWARLQRRRHPTPLVWLQMDIRD